MSYVAVCEVMGQTLGGYAKGRWAVAGFHKRNRPAARTHCENRCFAEKMKMWVGGERQPCAESKPKALVR